MLASPLDPGTVAAFEEIVGRQNVLIDPETVAGYVVDWTGRFRGRTPAVLRPGSTAEVAALIDLCRRSGVALTVQGGNTGLVGGSVPLAGEVVLSLRRLSAVGDVDPMAAQVTVGSGATIETLQRAAVSGGLAYGVDLGARAEATVGGTVATNAGGLRVLRYGPTRAQLAGMEAVLGTGETVSHLSGLTKDNTGYDLAGLLCGSEGTLGVVTAARVRLVPAAPCQAVALLAFASAAAAVAASVALRQSLASLSAAEIFFHDGLSLVCDVIGDQPPFDRNRPHHCYLLIEAAGTTDPSTELADVVASLSRVEDVAVALEPAPMAQLWRLREGHTVAINTLGSPHKLDVTLPMASLVEFILQVRAVVSAVSPGSRTWLFGHVGDGNIHVNVTGPAPDDFAVDEAVVRLAASMGGSISAEHGIGTAKREWLHLNRSNEEISVFRSIKRALDPDGILNPAVLLPPA